MPLFNVRFNGEGVPTDVLALEGRLKEEFSYKNYRDGDIGSGLDGTTVVTVDAIGAELAIARARRLFQGYMRLGKLTEEREKLFLVVLDEDVGEPIDIIQLPDTVNVECGEMVGSNVFVRAKNEDEAKEKALGVYYDRPFFRVFDKKTKKEADVEYMETYLKNTVETWAVNIDPEELQCWALIQDGDLVLLDMEGRYDYAPDRFDIVEED